MNYSNPERLAICALILCAACAAIPARATDPSPAVARHSPESDFDYVPRPATAAPLVASWDRGWEVGGAAGIALGDGVPANDMPLLGLFARRRLDDDWALRFTVEMLSFDFETPADVLGIAQDPNLEDIDASADAVGVGAWIERTWGAPSPNELFLGLGLGVSSVDVGNADGPMAGGGNFDIQTDAGTEFTAGAALGYRRHLSERWTLELVARLARHFADWKLEDQISNTTGNVDDYTTTTFLLGLSYGF